MRRCRLRWIVLHSISIAIAFVCIAVPATAARFCVLPATLPFDVDDGRRQLVDAMVLEEFVRASIEVKPSAEVDTARRAVIQRHPKLYDPRTGSPVRNELAAYDADLDQTFREGLKCDGLIHVGVKYLLAFYANEDVRWDGARRTVNDDSEGLAALVAHLGKIGANETGLVPVLSIWIRVTDTRQREVSFRSAGIEPLAGVTLAGGIEPLPEDRWLRDPEALRTAIQSALGPDARWLRERGWPRGIPGRAELPW